MKNQTYLNHEVLIASEDGIVEAMNYALERARGEIFVRIDDDVEMPNNWLEELVKPFSDPSVAGATGPTFVPKHLRDNRDSIRWGQNYNWFLRWLFDSAHFQPAAILRCGNVSYDSNYEERFEGLDEIDFEDYEPDHLEGTNWAMRTELIRKVGGFDPKFDGVSEWFDTDVEFKIKKLGYEFRYNPKAYLYHLLGKSSAHFNDRFQGIGRIKNWLRFHFRHGKFHYKMLVYLIVWGLYFLSLNFRRK